jgi:hypothetical protein
MNALSSTMPRGSVLLPEKWLCIAAAVLGLGAVALSTIFNQL